MKAAIITIGDEILIGQIIDTNSAWLGEQLSDLGVDLIESRSIKDEQSDIITHLQAMTQKYDLVLMTGGLGPTKDDVTKKAIADFLGVDLYYDAQVHSHIKAMFAKFGKKSTDAHKEQSYMPSGVKLLDNKLGTAPGMMFELKTSCLVSMPGVPYEMKGIFTQKVIPWIELSGKLQKIYHRTIRTAGMGETRIADAISEVTNLMDERVKLAFLPSKGTVRLRLTGVAGRDHSIEELVDTYATEIQSKLGTIVYGENKDLLEDAIGKLCREKNLTIGTAESCTGGKVASRIVSVPGSSAYYQASIVAYSYQMKTTLLDVPKQMLLNKGAVSEEVVVAMVNGLLNKTGVDVALSISGIAGPGGGTPDKPVGTIWMACGDRDTIKTAKLQLGKNRSINIDYTATSALNMLRKFLMLR